MTQLQSAASTAGHEQPLRVLMAVGAAATVGGLEASFARIQRELAGAGLRVEALVVGSAARPDASAAFLNRYLPAHRADSWAEITQALRGHDAVHVHGATSSIWPLRVVVVARLLRIPTVVTLHLPSHPPRQPRLRGELRSRLRLLARGLVLLGSGADVYAPSAAAAAAGRRQFRPLPVRVRALWNGVLDPGAAAVSTAGPLRLVFVGRLADHKRPLDFVSAVDAAATAGADVTADLVGDGPLRADVEQAIARSAHADRFRLHGQCDDPAPLMHAADLLVLTSLTEGCPLVAMEAAGAGRGVLARAGIEGLAEGWQDAFVAVPDGAGPEAFTAEIIKLARDRGVVERLGAAARLRFEERFSAERAASSLRAAYERAGR